MTGADMLFVFIGTGRRKLFGFNRLCTEAKGISKSSPFRYGTQRFTDPDWIFRAPVWTAFVTSNIGRRGWLQALDSRTILVRGLKPLVLLSADEYTLPQVASGEHVLRFKTPDGKSKANLFYQTVLIKLPDAEEFLDSLDELAAEPTSRTRGVRYV